MEQIETKKAQLSATMGDQQIIQLFFQRCEEAITQTQKKYGALCRSVAQQLLADPRDTEECVSDTYLRAWTADGKIARKYGTPPLSAGLSGPHHPESGIGPL